MKRGMLIGCMILGLLTCTGSAEAGYDYELAYGYSGRDSESRNAVAMDDWLERGRAAVTESPLFPDGIRLTAEGGEGIDEPGLASAIYHFRVPPRAQYLTISVRYNDTAQDDQIAARLWIKSSDTDMRGETGVGEEAPLYGDTFVLRSERSSESITVPTSRHVEGGTVELHIVVQGNDCIDVRDIRVEYLYTRPQITIVQRTCADYWDQWPRHLYAYHYFYWGPLFWPSTSVVYECWDVPIRFYWVTWRPWFFVNIIHVHHHQPWWGPRRYTVVYHVDVKQPLLKRRTLVRTRLREHQVQVTQILHTNPVARTNDRTTPVRTPSARKQEVRSKTEDQAPRIFEATASQNQTQRHVKEQPIQVDKGREEPKVDTQTKTVKIPQATNNRDSHSAHPTDTESQPRAAKQQPQPRSVTQEKTAQAPVPKQLNKPGKEIPKATAKVAPTPIEGNDTGQQVRETKQQKTPQADTRTKTVKGPQRSNEPGTDTTHQGIQKEQPQPRTVEQQPRSRSVARETVQGPAKVQAARDYSAQREPTVQRRATIGQESRPQSNREIRQERPQAGQRGRR